MKKETGVNKRRKEESLGQERPIEDPWGEICASKNTHGCIHVKGGSGASLFTDIVSTLKNSQVGQTIEAPYRRGGQEGRREIYRVGDSYREGVGEGSKI